MLNLMLLSQFSIVRDGQPITLTTRPAQSLLAYLALQPTLVHQREKVAGVLWPDSNESNARSNLRHALWRVRKAIGDEYITADKLTIGLTPNAPIDIDAQTVLMAEEDETAVAAYSGELLPGFYDDWVIFERERLNVQFVERVQRLTKQQLDDKQWQSVVQSAEKWLRFDVAEEAYQALMIAHQALGNRVGIKDSYERCVATLEQELDVKPSAETEWLFSKLLQEPSQASPFVDTLKRDYALHLPRFTTTFIGRESELAQLKRLIQDPEHRLITLLAPGGMGKTRLAIAAASAQAENFTDGIYFVPFSPISDVGHLASQVAETLNIDFYLREQSLRWKSDEQYDQIVSYLAQKKMLLIFDNVEQLLVHDEAKYAGISLTDFVNRLLRDAPDVTLLVTSRERLNLKTETVVPILGLQLPPLHKITAVALTEYVAQSDAIQLFRHCAQRIQPDFAITPDNIQDIIDICQLVGGMPLAIELAAAWQEMLSIAAIKAEIANSIDFLESTLRDMPERHRTIRAIFEATWQKLDDDERNAFSQLAIFCGGFRRRAAQTICNVSLKTLMGLIHKALLTVDETGRYQIHELLRQYGEEKLAQSHSLNETIRQKHCLYYADFLHQQEPILHGDQQGQALKQIEPEIPNARVAWEWAIANSQYDALEKAMESLCEYHRRRGQIDEGYKFFKPTAEKLGWHGWLPTYDNPSSSMVLEETLQLLDAGVQASPSTLDRQTVLGKTLARYARFYCESPDLERAALQLRQDALNALKQRGNSREMAWVLRYLGHVGQRPVHTEQLYQMALDFFEAQDDQRGIAETQYRLGVNAIDQGQYERAIPFLENGVALCQAIDNHAVEAPGIIRLSEAYWALGQNETAEGICNQALTLIKEINYPALLADAYQVLARIAWSRGDLNLATTHLNRSHEIFEELGLKGLLANTKARLAHVAAFGGKITVAKELAQVSIELCLTRDYPAGCCEAHMALGLITGEPTIVLSHLVDAMNIAQTSGLISYHLHALGYAVSALDSLQENNIAQQAITIISQHESSWHWTKQWLTENNLLSHSVPTSLELKEIILQIQSISSSTVNS